VVAAVAETVGMTDMASMATPMIEIFFNFMCALSSRRGLGT